MIHETIPGDSQAANIATLEHPPIERIDSDVLGAEYDLRAFTMPELRTLLRLNSRSNDAYTPKCSAISNALSERRAGHNEARAVTLDGIEIPDGVAVEKYPKETGWVFEVTKPRKGESAVNLPEHYLKDEQFKAMNLPLPPAGNRSLGIIVNRRMNELSASDSRSQVQAAMLVAIDQEGLLRRYELADPESTGYEAHKFGWHDADQEDLGIPTATLTVAQKSQHFIQVGVELDREIYDYKYGSVTEMIRPSLSESEQQAQAIHTGRPGRIKRYVGPAVMGLLSATSALAANAAVAKSDAELVAGVDYRSGQLTYDQLPTLKGTQGVEDFKSALSDYRNGDIEALTEKVESSEFGKHHIEQRYYEEVEQAANNDEVLDAVNSALEQYGVVVSFVNSNETVEYGPITDPQDEALKATVQGVLDFVDSLAPIVREEGNTERIIISDTIEPNGRDLLGRYDGDEKGVVVRLASGKIADVNGNDLERTRESAAEVLAHEQGHVLNLHSGAIPSLTELNPINTLYGHSAPNPDMLLRVGTEIATDYAAKETNREDEAETLATFQIGNPLEFEEINTVLDNKQAAVLAGIERNHPGFSAYMLLNDLESRQPAGRVERITNKARSVSQQFGIRVSEALLTAALLKGAVSAGNERRRRGRYTLQLMD